MKRIFLMFISFLVSGCGQEPAVTRKTDVCVKGDDGEFKCTHDKEVSNGQDYSS